MNNSCLQRNRQRVAVYRNGFTLVELLVSSAILSVLLMATGSSILLVSRGIPDGRSRTSKMLNAARTLNLLASDLAQATACLELNQNDIAFTVPDQNGDGLPETIIYTWSNVPDEPLIRVVNGWPSNVLTSLNEFQLTYELRAATGNGPTRNYLRNVGVILRCGEGPAATLHTTVRVLNQPQVN